MHLTVSDTVLGMVHAASQHSSLVPGAPPRSGIRNTSNDSGYPMVTIITLRMVMITTTINMGSTYHNDINITVIPISMTNKAATLSTT